MPIERYAEFRSKVSNEKGFIAYENVQETDALNYEETEATRGKNDSDKGASYNDLVQNIQDKQNVQIKGQFKKSDLTGLLAPDMNEVIVEAMERFDRIIPGFAGEEAVFAGIESRTSSPVRILRDPESLMSSFSGLYPCGEGAGYAGGIMSAAVDGIRVAEKVIQELSNL